MSRGPAVHGPAHAARAGAGAPEGGLEVGQGREGGAEAPVEAHGVVWPLLGVARRDVVDAVPRQAHALPPPPV